jgi:hypothetical protein
MTSGARDRDQAGRPRQARPRDATGRPLAYGDPRGVEPVPEEPLPPAETLALAQSLLDSGRAFSAHEVLEAAWKAAPATERDLWQGLAQICVGITHAQRGNVMGAARLLGRGIRRLRRETATRHRRFRCPGVARPTRRRPGRRRSAPSHRRPAGPVHGVAQRLLRR